MAQVAAWIDRQIDEARQQREELLKKLQEAEKRSPEAVRDSAVLVEQRRFKEEQLHSHQASIAETKAQAERDAEALRLQIAALGQEHGKLQLAVEVHRTVQQQGWLDEQLRGLQKNAFISNVDERRTVHLRIAELEAAIRTKDAEHQELLDAQLRAETARLAAVTGKQQLEDKVRELQRDNEHVRLELEAQSTEVERIEREMRLMRERLPLEGQEALEFALASVIQEEGAAFARMERPARDAVPTQEDLGSLQTMEQIVVKLQGEKAALAAHIAALREEVVQETAKSRDLRAAHAQALDEEKQAAQAAVVEREAWQRKATSHLSTIKALQVQASALDRLAVGDAGTDGGDSISVAGFSDLTDLAETENAIDVFVGHGDLHSTATASFPTAGPYAATVEQAQVRSVVCIELKGFDVGYSGMAPGLQPKYDSLVSFGPVVANDSLLRMLSSECLSVEVRGAMPGSAAQQLLGRCAQPLRPLLQLFGKSSRPNPALSVVATLQDARNPDVAVGRVMLKVRMRYDITDLAEEYSRRAGVAGMDGRRLRQNVDRRLDGAPRLLSVLIHRVDGLQVIGARQAPDALRPYVSYQLPGRPPVFTRAGCGPSAALNEGSSTRVEVDEAFCEWVEGGGGLHFIVFDDAAEVSASRSVAHGSELLGVIGEVRVPLQALLRDATACIDGPFKLSPDMSRPGAPHVGMVELTIRWQDFAAEASGPAPLVPKAGLFRPRAITSAEFQVILGRMVARMVRRFHIPVERTFDTLDTSGGGAIHVQDFVEFARRHEMGVSGEEAASVYARMERQDCGAILMPDLRATLAVLARPSASRQAQEQWLTVLLGRLREAMQARQDTSLSACVDQLAAEPGAPAGIDRERFGRLLRVFRRDLTEAHLDALWLMADKEWDGLLDFKAFEHAIFGSQPAKAQEKVASAATGAAPAMEMSEEYIGIIVGRFVRRLLAEGVATVEEVVAKLDADGDGRLAREELVAGLAQHAPNLSQLERTALAARLDGNGDGVLSVAELNAAFTKYCAVHAEALGRAERLFARVSCAVGRSTTPPQQIFAALSGGQGVLGRDEFDKVMRSFVQDLTKESLELMWELADKNSDGAVHYDEFARTFVPADAFGGKASAMSDEHFFTLIGRLLRQLRSAGYATYEEVLQRFDHDRDGRVSREELDFSLSLDAPNLSRFERGQVVVRLDADHDGAITVAELQAAFEASEAVYAAAEAKALEVFDRVRAAVAASSHAPHAIFSSLCAVPEVMQRAELERFLREFDPRLTAPEAELMWQFLDKNRDGALTFEEFAKNFVINDGPPPIEPEVPADSAPPAAAPAMSDEHFAILVGRLLRRVQAAGLATYEQVLQRFDHDGDGSVSRSEMEVSLTVDAPNLSRDERAALLSRIDSDNDNVITTAELQAAFEASAAVFAAAEARAEELFARVREAISKAPLPPRATFGLLCAIPTAMRRSEFERLVQQFVPELTALEVEVMWQLMEKNNDGSLVFDEFARVFVPAEAAPEPAAGAPLEPEGPLAAGAPAADAAAPLTSVGSAAAPGSAAPALPVRSAMDDEHFGIFVGRLLRKLRASGLQTVEQVVQRFDYDGDGRVTSTELGLALMADAPSFSRAERAQLIDRVDADGDGIISVPELKAAFELAETAYASAEARAQEWFERARATLSKSPFPPRAIFEQVCSAPEAMQKAEFERFVRQFAAGVEAAQAELMWQLLDKGGDGALLGYDEFARRFVAEAAQPDGPPATTGGPAGGALDRMAAAIAAQESTVYQLDEYFQLCCTSGGATMRRPEFEALVQSFEPSLSPFELARAWQTVTGDASATELGFTAFLRQFCPCVLEEAVPMLHSGKQIPAYLHRLECWQSSSGSSLLQALSGFATAPAGVVGLEGFVRACGHYGLGLSRLEAERLFGDVATPLLGGLGLRPQDLVLRIEALAQLPFPEVKWAQDILDNISQRAAASGRPLDAAFVILGEAVDASLVKSEFERHLALDKQQWSTILVLLRKSVDGRVLWRESLRWAGALR